MSLADRLLRRNGARSEAAGVGTPDGGRPAGSPILVCEGVDVAYDKVQVLFGVDLEVGENEVIALLGTNGEG